jgi:hypothetical protein
LNWSAIYSAAAEALNDLEGPVAQQAEILVGAFEAALPAIEKGAASAEPFIVGGFKLITSGPQGLPADEWAAQLALMDAQVATVDAQVAADTLNGG